jgi:hypothetical protein
LDEPYPGPPDDVLVHPSLAAAEPSGFTHDTWTQLPADAIPAVTVSAAVARATAVSARRIIA